MTKDEIVPIIVTDVPEKIRNALVRSAVLNRTSVNETAARILCATYGVKREPSTRNHLTQRASEARMVLRVPAEVRHRLRVEAAQRGVTISGLVKVALARHFRLRVPDPAKRKPTMAARHAREEKAA